MSQVNIEKRIRGISSMIGNTPMLELRFTYKGEERFLFAKAENFNMTGSIKDRMAFHIIKKACERGKIKPGGMLVEATSGNTGISFSAIGRALGYSATIFMPDWMSDERKKLIRSLGADIRLVSEGEGGFLRCIKMAEKMAKGNENIFLPNQFSNYDNIEAHYLTTGPEIWSQLRFRGLTPDAFVAGVGTGGTVMGVGKFLRENKRSIKVYPLEPANSPTLSTGYKVGKHRIQGISDEFIPPIIKLSSLDEIISVDDGDAIIMAQKLAAELGLGVGISSGANFLGALKVQEKLGRDSIVATVFPDDNKKYLSTDLLKEEHVKQGFISPHIKLVDVKSFKRMCYTCCNPQECREAYGGWLNK